MLRRRGLLLAGLATTPAAAAEPVVDWPTRPLRLLVPAAPGGQTDLPARLLAAAMTRSLGQPVLVENRSEAAGSPGAAVLRGAAPDGHTLLYGNAASTAQAPARLRRPAWNPADEPVPVMLAVVVPCVLVVRADGTLRTLDDMLALARREGRVTLGTAGAGGLGHILAQILSRQTALTFEPVPFPNHPAAIEAVLAGRLDSHYGALGRAQVEAGLLHPVATSGPARLPAFPAAPTLAELGFRGADLLGWSGLLAPRGTSATIVSALNLAANLALHEPDLREQLTEAGLEPQGGSAARFGAFIAAEYARYRHLAAAFNLYTD